MPSYYQEIMVLITMVCFVLFISIFHFFCTDIVSNNLFLFTKIECKIRGR